MNVFLCFIFHLYTSTVNVGLAVGLSVGLSFLFFCVGIPICIVVCAVCASNKHRHSTLRTHVVATTPSGGTTVVTANQATATSVPIAQPLLQQQAYEDAQFSSQVAPPSYTAATTFPTYTGPPPQVMYWWLSVQIPSTHCLYNYYSVVVYPEQHHYNYVEVVNILSRSPQIPYLPNLRTSQ